VNIPELELDNLTWKDLVEIGRQAIPAASDGQWTLHAPVDPGITLMELFAAELEQRLFMLDQVPDTLVRAVMQLLLGRRAGPRPAQPAVGILQLASRAGVVRLPAGSELHRAAGERLVLTTEHTALVIPGAAVAAFQVAGADVWPRMLTGEPAPVFGPDGSHAAVLTITASVPATEHRLFLAIAEPTVARGWLAATEPPRTPTRLAAAVPPTLGWVRDSGRPVFLDRDGQPVRTAALGGLAAPADQAPRWHALVGGQRWPLQVEDATAGLRVSGVVRLRPPPGRTFPATVRLEISKPASGTPVYPLLSSITPNAVIARHRRLVSHDEWATEAKLPLPHYELQLDDAAPHAEDPLDRVIDGRGLASLAVHRNDGTTETWTAVEDLAFSNPDSRHLEIDRERGVLRFGDGRTGRIVRWDEGAMLRRTYWLGGGTAPQVGAGTTFVCSGEHAGVLDAKTASPLLYGQEPESAEAARARAAQELLHPSRAVTTADVTEIIGSLLGVRVARVHVEPRFDPAHPVAIVPDAMTVFCVPLVPRRSREDVLALTAPELDSSSLRAIAQILERSRLAGSQVAVRGPAWHDIEIVAEIAVAAADAAAVLHRAEYSLRHVLDPLIGGSRGEGWDFGAPVRPADLSAVLQRSLRRQGEVVRVQVANAGQSDWTDCNPLPLAAYELPRLRELRVVAM
jgi:predicted phage baseplate assembly protein